MRRFAVVLTEGLPVAAETIERHYDENYLSLTDDVFLISGDTNVKSITETLGLSEEGSPVEGIVFSLNGSYGGRALSAVWDWLEKTPA